jgi:hypothetical protein
MPAKGFVSTQSARKLNNILAHQRRACTHNLSQRPSQDPSAFPFCQTLNTLIVFVSALLMDFLNTAEKKDRRMVHLPMGRFGEAIEVARGALFRKFLLHACIA